MNRSTPQRLARHVALATLLACQACELAEHDLDAFQSTATGPEKIRAVLEDGAKDPELRARAALLLLDIDRHDLRGPEVLQRELSALESKSRGKLIEPLARLLFERMHTDRDVAPSAAAIRAKNALERALPLLTVAQRKQIGQTLIAWIVGDVPRRADVGGHALEVLTQTLGPDAAAPLLSGLRSDVPLSDIARISALLHRHADQAARGRAATRLLDIAHSLQTPPALLHALGDFADQPNVRALLLAIAQDKARSEIDRADALRLLTSHMTAHELLPVLSLALDESQSLALREIAVVRAGETRSSEALPGLLMLLGDRTHARLRMLAGQQVLDIGGPKMLSSFFRALPHGWGVPYSREEIDSYSARVNQFGHDTALLLLLGEKMSSSLWWPRVLALRYFAARGLFEDLWRMRKHVGDTAPIIGDGWPRGYTVGQEAEGCVSALNERLLRGR